MTYDKTEEKTSEIRGGCLESLILGGSCLASLAAGALLGELADVYITRPIAQRYNPEFNLYWTFAASTATGMALTLLGWKKLIAPLFYRIKTQE